MNPEAGVVDVQKEEDPELSSYRFSELGVDDDRVVWPVTGGLAEILVLMLFFRTLTGSGCKDFAFFPNGESLYIFEVGVVSNMSPENFSINLVSQGFVAIHRSNQLHPQLFLSISCPLSPGTYKFDRDLLSVLDFHCQTIKNRKEQMTILL